MRYPAVIYNIDYQVGFLEGGRQASAVGAKQCMKKRVRANASVPIVKCH
jgi:hypothetical protein